MSCKWDSDAGDYLRDGQPCKHDDYGDPTRHCTARRTCSQHVATNEQTCARCLARTRQDIRWIKDYAALLPTAAMSDGVNSESAYLAGPAADVEAWSWRKISAKQGIAWHMSLVEDDDDWHPFTVLTRWHWMIAIPYKHDHPEVFTIVNSADYLDRHLHRIAQDDTDDGPDFREMRSEMRACRQHLENVLHDSPRGMLGAPCPECVAAGQVNPKHVRLRCQFAHYCDDPDCEQMNYDTDASDVWVCPRNKDHWMTAEGYRNYTQERTA